MNNLKNPFFIFTLSIPRGIISAIICVVFSPYFYGYMKAYLTYFKPSSKKVGTYSLVISALKFVFDYIVKWFSLVPLEGGTYRSGFLKIAFNYKL